MLQCIASGAVYLLNHRGDTLVILEFDLITQDVSWFSIYLACFSGYDYDYITNTDHTRHVRSTLDRANMSPTITV